MSALLIYKPKTKTPIFTFHRTGVKFTPACDLNSPDSYIQGPCSDNALCIGKHNAHGHSAGFPRTYEQSGNVIFESLLVFRQNIHYLSNTPINTISESSGGQEIIFKKNKNYKSILASSIQLPLTM